MIDSFYIAWKYLFFSKVRFATLVACITLIAILPLALEIILDESEQQLVERAEHTPLLVGARGSALDLVMNSLYFADEVPQPITLASADEITATELAFAIPLYVRFQARGFPIVGTTLDYFDFRQLRLAAGEPFGLLGECVIGAAVARQLGLKPGDSLLSSPETVFDLAGVYPLKMRVAGVLAPTHSADDLAVLVDPAEAMPPSNAVVCIGSSSMRMWHATIARDLAPLGYIIDIYDNQFAGGGMMRSQIPSFRLPLEVLDVLPEEYIESLDPELQAQVVARLAGEEVTEAAPEPTHDPAELPSIWQTAGQSGSE